MLHRMIGVCAIVLFLPLGGCGNEPEESIVGPEHRVGAYVEAEELVITNYKTKRIWTFVIGNRAGATVLWAPNLAGEGIEPGRRKRIPLDEILMAPDEDELLVYYWGAKVEDGDVVPDEVRSLRVTL